MSLYALFAVATLCKAVTAYQVMSEPYSMRETFLKVLGDSKFLNPLSRYDYFGDDAANVGFQAPVERQYSAEVNGLYPWTEESDDKYFDRVVKGNEEQQLLDDYAIDDPLTNPMTRDQEYLQHSSLWGHHYIQGGAGEGDQILKPDGSQKNTQDSKTDAVLPAYCDPPNPCPLGFTAEDGCLEDFENTAAFSREYQEAQDCLCDAEHMFGCGDARNGGMGPDDNDNTLNELLSDYKIFGQHKSLVAKKFHAKKSDNLSKLREKELREKAAEAAHKFSRNPLERTNEFLAGEKLPIAAKKGAKLA